MFGLRKGWGEPLTRRSDRTRRPIDHAANRLLIKIGVAHAYFETVHPFLDGNGRVGRLLLTFMLCEQHVLQKPVLYLSYYFKKNRSRYYELLQCVRDEGDWERWLEFFVQGVHEISVQATETARRILLLRESERQLITEGFGRAAGSGLRVVEQLFQHPIVSVNDVSGWAETGFPAANNLVSRLVEAGILVEVTGQARNRRFLHQSYTDLFADEG